jgi:glycosyltransferase involved in cell wall biosynthesis
MKVLQINNCHYKRGGADIVYLNTIELLQKNGNNVFCFSTKNSKNIPSRFEKYFNKSPNFTSKDSFLKKIVNIPRFIFSFSTIFNLKRLLNEHNPDIAHVHLYKGGLTSSFLIVLKKLKIPIVITLHDYGFLDPHNLLLDGNHDISIKTINGSPFNAVIDKHNRNSYVYSMISYIEYKFNEFFFPFDKWFDLIICVSKFSKNLHESCKRYNFNLEHLYNFSLLENNHKVDLKPSNKRYVLFFGRLSKEKGILTLLKSFKSISQNYSLKILGEGPIEDELKNYATKNKLNNVEFLGHMVGNKLVNYIRSAHVVVVPSEVYENNPMTIIESYSLGVPVIGSNDGGIPELIVNGKTGFTFKMYDFNDLTLKINLFLNMKPEDYKIYKSNCLKFSSKKFSKQVHLKKLLNIYKKTIKKYDTQKNI